MPGMTYPISIDNPTRLDELDLELEKAYQEFMAKREVAIKEQQKAMEEVKDLVKGKTVLVGVKLLDDLMVDSQFGAFYRLPLNKVMLYMGKARNATQQEIAEMQRR